jgi:hypothetical protein
LTRGARACIVVDSEFSEVTLLANSQQQKMIIFAKTDFPFLRKGTLVRVKLVFLPNNELLFGFLANKQHFSMD